MKWRRPAVILVTLLGCSHANAAAGRSVPVEGEAVVDQTGTQLDQLVAPIALYPDALVAQVLAACTYPTEIVEADRWMQQHPDLHDQDLAKAVDQQSWDPSIKAVAQLPSVLANLDKNLSWASALGDAYVNQQQDVLDAVQRMRKRAEQAGNLTSTPQQTVTTQGSTIVIQPASPEVVYVPTYDPWVVYGPPVIAWPGWYWYPGLYAVGPGISFGLGFGVGFYAGFGWGWHHWGADWRGRRLTFDHGPWISHSRTFIDHDHFHRGGPGFHDRPGFHAPVPNEFHGRGEAHFAPGIRSGAFSGFNHGGVTRGFAGRGALSAGGRSGGMHAGGGHR